MRVIGNRVFVDVTGEPLSADTALAFCDAPGHGAAALFVGRVRDHNAGRTVQGISYEIHAPLARQVFSALCEAVCERWGPEVRVWLVHRHGRLAVGEASVIAAASTPHRDEAFRACRFLIEEMKHRAPIWKREHYVDGDSEWVQGHALCGHD